MNKDVIIPCDFEDAAQTMAFLARLAPHKPFVKIGMELFYSAGPDIVRRIKDMGLRVFLDLKLHDIPNTVLRAMRILGRLGVDMVNVHAAGTVDMMRAAKEGLLDSAAGRAPLLIAVTQLTSTSEARMQTELLISADIGRTVAHYAENALRAGLDGVVCSPLETELVKSACGADFLTVTPGIRYPESKADDQQRVTTPQLARRLGADFIVVGRPITRADDPAAAYARVLADFLG